MGKLLYITYCAAEKDQAEGLMPAAWRYKSSRIEAVLALAVERAVDFRILSGEYGLLAAGESIPWYDHLLADAEVPGHAARVAAQLAEIAPAHVLFFMRAPDVDPGTGPYLECCRRACAEAGIPLKVVELPAGRLQMGMLDMLLR